MTKAPNQIDLADQVALLNKAAHIELDGEIVPMNQSVVVNYSNVEEIIDWIGGIGAEETETQIEMLLGSPRIKSGRVLAQQIVDMAAELVNVERLVATTLIVQLEPGYVAVRIEEFEVEQQVVVAVVSRSR